MTDTILDNLVVRLRADTANFQSGIASSTSDMKNLGATASRVAADMRGAWDNGSVQNGVSSALNDMGAALGRFVRDGKLSFADLRSTALSAIADIATAWIKGMTQASGLSGSGGGLVGDLVSAITDGLTKRATGGPVAAGTPYLVGEQGPELFVPDASGQILSAHSTKGDAGGRPINITINMNGGGANPAHARESAGQIAATMRRALITASRNM